MYITSRISAVFMLLALGCASPPETQPEVENVSMVQLIMSPEKFVGETISVTGFLTAHGDMLFLTEDHYQLMDGASMIYVKIDYNADDKIPGTERKSTGCENQYARLDGTFIDIGYGYHAIWDVFSISKPRGLPAPGPKRFSCWQKDDTVPGDGSAR